LEIISILAPSLNSRLGTEALKSALYDVLKRQSDQSEIRLEVNPESAPDIDKFIETIWSDPENAPNYTVVANSEIEKGACQINWKDGGMIRDPQKTAKDIKEAIEALLVEQVISNPKTPLTQEENNAIKMTDDEKKQADKAPQQDKDASMKYDEIDTDVKQLRRKQKWLKQQKMMSMTS